ncbi:MAG: lipase/acyltransferase domain-containing protein [Candidatus Hodarchaeales archaeon]|jgi:pimeloyl-ACP methyl ester carboxylesterase
MQEFEYQITDVYEEDNLIDGVVQYLPAYFRISFNTEAKYIITAESPEGMIAGNLTGMARPGLNYEWRLPIYDSPGHWKIEIHLHIDQEKSVHDYIPLNVPPELLELSSDEEELFNEYFSEVRLPKEEDIQHVDGSSRLAELDAHWLQVDPELGIWRYIHQDTESQLGEGQYIPILLVHGFRSSYTTWNWMVRYLWRDGFRNIFGMALYDDRLGVEKNCEHLESVISKVLALTGREELYLISHSLGGHVARYFVKKRDCKSVKMLAIMGAGHYGVWSVFGKLMTIFGKAPLTDRDLTCAPGSKLSLSQSTFTEADLYLLTMINICGTKLRGSDGFITAKKNYVPDMINFNVDATHFSVHKNEDTYRIIKNVLFGKSVIYKIRLLYITPTEESSPPNCKLHLLVKPKTRDYYQRYPNRNFIQLEGKPYIPQIPMIVFASLRNNAKNEHLAIQVLNEENEIVAEEEFIFGLGDKEEVVDHFSLETGTGYFFQFAVYSYRLHYQSL